MPDGFFSIFSMVVGWTFGIVGYASVIIWCFAQAEATDDVKMYIHRKGVRTRFNVAGTLLVLLAIAFVVSLILATN